MFQIVRLRLRANTPVLCHLLVGSVLPSFLFQSSLVHSVLCCNSEVSELSFQFFFVCGVCLIILSLVFTRNFCDEICFTKNNKLSCFVLLQCAASTCLLFWFYFLSTALASRSVEGVVGSQLFLGSRPTQSALFSTRAFRNNRGVEKAPELQRVWR